MNVDEHKNPKPFISNPKHQTPNPKPQIPKLQTPNPKPETLNPKPQTSKSQTPNSTPEPQTPSPKTQFTNHKPQTQPRNTKPKTPNPKPGSNVCGSSGQTRYKQLFLKLLLWICVQNSPNLMALDHLAKRSDIVCFGTLLKLILLACGTNSSTLEGKRTGFHKGSSVSGRTRLESGSEGIFVS